MTVKMQFDTRPLKAWTARQAKRLAFNTAQAINETMKQAQAEERSNVRRKFQVRKPITERAVKISAFANARQNRPYAEITIDAKPGQFLGEFERGAERKVPKWQRALTFLSEQFPGGVLVPVTGGPARPSFPQLVQRAFRASVFRLRPRKRGRGVQAFHPGALAAQQSQLVGGKGTFTIPGKGIFQRTGERVQAVYLAVQHPRLDARLEFVKTVTRTIARNLHSNFLKAYRR